ncbi:delta(1)-pyrroline-2-carboxylate reductase family protein [Brenneria tiliae]|uniref:delta(1)-pyrroline-2-carboxylate reductase family protein n=1 Tax=Brenneria tiliae TaxID=2914984 RepID=UPI002014E27B|nr:delta(1)-pyrroline-2-carboxylate reductase family protein [Brenneria tiliae]MCL2899103.1 delta(1)-pyrroline-2-carboxylate reductase family protein [Brenneria tiliae]MCL2903481.1 delta(1)-pyrroline-2-carboxylate reductase family protein [Brenneria tiliae]
MQFFDAAATAKLLPYDRLADALDLMARQALSGQALAPVRQSVPAQNGGVLLLMPASDARHLCVKLLTVHAGNPDRGLPAIQGELVLMRADTGERLLSLDAPTVTARRTAALSLLGARKLAHPDADSLLLIGSGVQAKEHIQAFARQWPLRRVRILSRRLPRAAALADYAREHLGLDAQAIEAVDQREAQAGLIVAATTSRTPVLSVSVSDDSTIIAVGAYQPEMAEIAPAVVHSCDLFVDTLEGAREEAGDLMQAGVEWSRVQPIGGILNPRPRQGRPVMFKTVGSALWDLAAAKLAAEMAGLA